MGYWAHFEGDGCLARRRFEQRARQRRRDDPGDTLQEHRGKSGVAEAASTDRFSQGAHCHRRNRNGVVMLHLRSCYVSKAAILTIPALLVAVENRSPA